VQLHLRVRVVVFKEFTNGRIQQNKRSLVLKPLNLENLLLHVKVLLADL